MNYVSFALLSALAASGTALLAKLGVAGVPSNLATTIRGAVALVFAAGIVLARGEARDLHTISAKSYVFLLASGICTGISWLAYFKALSLSDASKVTPLDKLSLPLTVALAWLLLGEPISPRLGLGVTLMTVGALLTIGA